MSREDLKGFFHAVEHSSALRSKLQSCQGITSIVALAKSYGFKITTEDLDQDDIAEKTTNWFEVSRLSPLRKNTQ